MIHPYQHGYARGKLLKKIEKIDYMYLSTLKRTQETALIALNQCQHRPKTKSIKEFNERNFGIWEGKTANEVELLDNINWEIFLKKPFDAIPKKGESFYLYKRRVLLAWDKIIKSHEDRDTILFLLHLGVLRVIIKERIELDKNFWSIQIPQGKFLIYNIKRRD